MVCTCKNKVSLAPWQKARPDPEVPEVPQVSENGGSLNADADPIFLFLNF
jgi:hypothetical protein